MAAVVIVLVNVLGKPKAAPVTVNLNDYVVVTVEGRSGNGEADATIDTERLKADFSESLVWTCKTKNQPTDQTVMDLLCDNVAVYLNTYYSISNGDVLEVEVCDYFSDYNEYLSDYYGNNAVIECSNFTYTVEGLEEATGFDPFEGAEVSITGSEGETYVTLTLRDDLEVMGSLWITTDDDLYSLHNGDVIHYYIEGYDESEEELLKSLYGYYPTVTTWEYTVEGLSHYGYITNFADIDETMLTDLGQAYDDWLTGVYAGQDFIDAGILLTGIENMGYYYWILKDGASDIDTNVLYVVMKANFTYKDTAGKDATLTAWNYARITDLYLETDGSVTFYEGSFDDFNIAPDATFVTECYDDIEWTCTGYLDKASLIADIKLEEDNFRILATNME